MACRLRRGVRRDDHLGEDLDDRLGRLGVERAVERDDAAEGRDRIAGAAPCGRPLSASAPTADAAGIGVLDDGDGGGRAGVELGDQLEGGVGVVDVVVGELLALQLARAWRRPAGCSPST